LATKLLNRVRDLFHVDLTVRDLFIHSTIFAMAKLLDSHQASGSLPSSPVPGVDLMKEVASHDQPVGR
jgi:hypothetical protein